LLRAREIAVCVMSGQGGLDRGAFKEGDAGPESCVRGVRERRCQTQWSRQREW